MLMLLLCNGGRNQSRDSSFYFVGMREKNGKDNHATIELRHSKR
uniref:Uncharacterized protein n=1 Tax=Arundo donax TaxID=35708 RepID=A0A0A9H4B4_ARUDO